MGWVVGRQKRTFLKIGVYGQICLPNPQTHHIGAVACTPCTICGLGKETGFWEPKMSCASCSVTENPSPFRSVAEIGEGRSFEWVVITVRYVSSANNKDGSIDPRWDWVKWVVIPKSNGPSEISQKRWLHVDNSKFIDRYWTLQWFSS